MKHIGELWLRNSLDFIEFPHPTRVVVARNYKSNRELKEPLGDLMRTKDSCHSMTTLVGERKDPSYYAAFKKLPRDCNGGTLYDMYYTPSSGFDDDDNY